MPGGKGLHTACRRLAGIALEGSGVGGRRVDPMSESKPAVLAALVGNSALAILKGISAAMTGSAAMLAETFHSVADAGNQALLVLGMRLARRPPDEMHPFGHGKNVYFWAFVVSVMLFTLGGAFSVWEAVRKILHPGEHAPSWWAYGVLGAGFVFETISLGVAVRALQRERRGRSLRRYWRETRDPTLLTVLLEDAAALVSLVVAAGGLALAQVTGRGLWDAVASGAIGVILLGVAVALAFENYSLLIGERAPEDVERRIHDGVADDDAVVAVGRLRTMHVGPHEVIVMLRVQLRQDLTTSGVTAVIGRLHDRVERALSRDFSARFVIIEPVEARAARRVA
jgi:cation diffusion facilitator family transporter